MKEILALIFCLFLLGSSITAQVQKIITIKAGTRVIDYFPFNERYRYPEFTAGKVVFRNGTFTAARLNYYILGGEIQFIQKKDTLAIANVKDVDYVEIMQDTFYYDNGFLEVLAGRDRAVMTVKQYIKIMDVKKDVGYGTSSNTATDSYSSMLSSDNHYFKLKLNGDMVLSRNTDYYLGDHQNGFLPFRKNNIFKLFPQQKPTIESYLRKNSVDYTKVDDLIRLTDFLQDFK